MNLITLDIETYFDQDYSLSKMTTEEYVRDPRFKAHCVGIRWPNGDGTRSAGTELKSYMDWRHTAVLCHHAQFDGLILSHHYNVKPAFWFDTLSMARLVFPHAKSHSLKALAEMLGLPEKTVPYDSFKGVRDLPPDLYNRVADGCAQDVELTYAVFRKLLPFVPKEELQIIDLTIRMFTEPALALDRPRLQNYLNTLTEKKQALLDSLGVTKADLHSADKFAGLLRALNVEPPTKPSPSNKDKMIYAFAKTDEGMKELLEDEDERVQLLAGARLGQKSTLGETRAKRLLDMSGRGALPVYLRYCGAHTTRWSGGDGLNWQNFPRGSDIRLSIKAPEGFSLVVIDLAQIECRMLNWLAGEASVLEAFRNGDDLYSQGASRFYGREITKKDKTERHLGKTLELGCGYGMGWEKFQLTCKRGALGGPPIVLADDEAKQAVKSYRDSHPAVTKLWKHADRMLATLMTDKDVCKYPLYWGPMAIYGKKIILPNSACLDYSNLIYDGEEYKVTSRRGASKIYGAKLVENVVQALSRVVLSQAMLKIAPLRKIVLTCHDELVILCRTEEAQECLSECLQIMKTPPAWCPGLPLDAEGTCDVRYSK